MIGLDLTVLRRADGVDLSLGGITARHAVLTLVGTFRVTPGAVPFTALTEGRTMAAPKGPTVVLDLYGGGARLVEVTVDTKDPADASAWVLTHAQAMAGGHYATATDARFGRLVDDASGGRGFYGALPVLDRIET